MADPLDQATIDEISRRLGALATSPPGRRLGMDDLVPRARRRRFRRRVARVGSCALVIAAVVVAAVVADLGDSPSDIAMTPQQDSPEARITPSEALADGQLVDVVLIELPASSSAAMCAADATPASVASRCDVRTMSPLEGHSGYRVHRSIEIASGPRDCADPATPCAVAVGLLDGPIAFAPVTFAPQESPPPPPALALVAPEPIRGDGAVAVRAVGFRPGEEVGVMQCPGRPGEPGCMSLTGAVFIAASDGSFAGDVPVSRRVFTTSGPRDCLADGCRLVAETPTSGRVEAVIQFDPGAPLPPSPSLAVSPAGPYRPGQTVRVTGSGMPANTQVDISICAGDPEIDPGERRCVNVAGGAARSDAQGGFAIDGLPVLAQSGGIDCLAEPRGCYLAYAPSHFPVVARTSIAFTR